MDIQKIFDIYFDGEKNCFTTDIYGYDKKHITGDFYLVFEKSENKVLSDNITYGCSVLLFENDINVAKNIDLSKAFSTKEELEDYINQLSLEDVRNAKKYGETKTIH